jgi:predicted transcriptional regulator
MAQTALFTLDDETVRRLRELAPKGDRSKFIAKLINAEFDRKFNDGEAVYAPGSDEDILPLSESI